MTHGLRATANGRPESGCQPSRVLSSETMVMTMSVCMAHLLIAR